MRRLLLLIVLLVPVAAAAGTLPPGTLMVSGTALSHSVSLPLSQMPGCAPTAGSATIVEPAADFDGTSRSDLGGPCNSGGFASDDSGAIGPDHFVQVVNFAIAVFDRAGNRLAGPVFTTTFWRNQPTCGGNQTWSDSVVIYDARADRWVMSRPGGLPKGADLCLAVSQTGDPTGQWDEYAFPVNDAALGLDTYFDDYPKIAAWTHAYLATANPNKIFSGLGNTLSAFDRRAMLAGEPAPGFVTFFVPAPAPSGPGVVVHSHILPAGLDGTKTPPPHSPAYFVQVQDSHFGFPAGRLQVYALHVDWGNPAAARLTAGADLTPQPFDSHACPQQSCIAQPSGPKLDSLSYGYMMFRLTYRNFGAHQTLLFNHTVAADGVPSHDHAGIRWYELRKSGGAPWRIHQQGTYAPDADNRWLGSIAMDKRGNILLAYDVSGAATFPSIRYVGRRAGDPLGQLPRGEGTIVAGGGGQSGSSIFFGDYSELTVDPKDDCTFWDTGTYYPAMTAANDWHTRIAAIRFPDCR